MPKVKTNRVKYTGGWELIEPTLRELQGKLRAAENDPRDGKRKCETLWPIFKIAHQKSRYIFNLYHRRREISKELFEFCLDQGYADRNIIAKWKKVVCKDIIDSHPKSLKYDVPTTKNVTRTATTQHGMQSTNGVDELLECRVCTTLIFPLIHQVENS